MAPENIGLVLVEQHAELALTLTNEAVILERGIIAHRARSQGVLQDEAMLDRFLGLQLRSPANGAGP